MELGADNGTSHSALLGHATVVVLLGSADGAAADGDTAEFKIKIAFERYV